MRTMNNNEIPELKHHKFSNALTNGTTCWIHSTTHSTHQFTLSMPTQKLTIIYYDLDWVDNAIHLSPTVIIFLYDLHWCPYLIKALMYLTFSNDLLAFTLVSHTIYNVKVTQIIYHYQKWVVSQDLWGFPRKNGLRNEDFNVLRYL